MTILANLQNFSLAFGEKVLFQNGNLTISENDRIGLIGLNGHGKSTLLRMINEEINPDISNPAFIYDKNSGLNILSIPQSFDIEDFPELTIHNFYLAFYPELYSAYKKLWIIESEIESGENLDRNIKEQESIMHIIQQKQGWEIAHAYESYIKKLGIGHIENLHHMSGGEKRKIALSVGLSTKANLVLWDEPTNHLDVETIEFFEDEIQKSNQTFVMVSHDRYLLGNICNKIIHISHGKIIPFSGNYLEYLEHLEMKEQERLKNLDRLSNYHRRELAWMRQGIKARGTRSKKRVEGYNNLKSEIANLKSQTKKVVDLTLAHSGRKTKQLLEIKNASFAYDKKTIVQDVTVSLFKGDKVALIGKNGQGKTTLINLIKGSLIFHNGEIKRAQDLSIGIFTQNRTTLDLNKTPFEIIGDGQDFVHLADGRTQHVNSYLENFLFQSTEIRRPISTLSGGELNRLQLALFMKEANDLWIFDEPTNDLDIETIEILESKIKDYQNAVIIISHDRAFLDNTVNTSWLLHNKELEVFQGGYTQIAPYLRALEIESSEEFLTEKEKETEELIAPSESPQIEDADNPRMNNKEKMRYKVIEKEIEEAETKLDEYSTKLAEFDFASMDESKNKIYEDLNMNQKHWEEKLEALYEEWEDLSQKRP